MVINNFPIKFSVLDFEVNQIIGRIEPVCGQWSMGVLWQQMAELRRSVYATDDISVFVHDRW